MEKNNKNVICKNKLGDGVDGFQVRLSGGEGRNY